jgi:predicted nucleic acid-binding protein
MNVVDSSGWLEYFADGPNADFFAPAIEATEQLLVPVICVYEVFKRILQQRGLGEAETRTADLYKGTVIELTPALAISAAVISDNHKLPMADSIILATAQAYEATLWTQDEHFQGIAGVEYIAKPSPNNLNF